MSATAPRDPNEIDQHYRPTPADLSLIADRLDETSEFIEELLDDRDGFPNPEAAAQSWQDVLHVAAYLLRLAARTGVPPDPQRQTAHQTACDAHQPPETRTHALPIRWPV